MPRLRLRTLGQGALRLSVRQVVSAEALNTTYRMLTVRIINLYCTPGPAARLNTLDIDDSATFRQLRDTFTLGETSLTTLVNRTLETELDQDLHPLLAHRLLRQVAIPFSEVPHTFHQNTLQERGLCSKNLACADPWIFREVVLEQYQETVLL